MFLRQSLFLQIVKNYNFVTQSQLKEDQEIVKFCRKCISYREKLTGDENEVTKTASIFEQLQHFFLVTMRRINKHTQPSIVQIF